MISFKSSTSKTGKIKDIRIVNGEFVDDKSGEVVDLTAILGRVYGNEVFEMSTTQKVEDEIE